MELEALQRVVSEITDLGATLVAISPQLENYTQQFSKDKGLTFAILSDPGNRVAQKFNLVHELPEDLRKVYLGFGIDLVKFNGDASWTLPMPARFLIDTEGIIRSADARADYTVRPEPSDTLAKLRVLVNLQRPNA